MFVHAREWILSHKLSVHANFRLSEVILCIVTRGFPAPPKKQALCSLPIEGLPPVRLIITPICSCQFHLRVRFGHPVDLFNEPEGLMILCDLFALIVTSIQASLDIFVLCSYRLS